ncbi:SRPBCC family protein [Halogeometricum limi]|uniref:Polyketide cyclase / dehydrase and lipid transport n=1 Tax=Halogeometricum limi TaxID=555875 RepID=A0A1I6GSB3_9EURY|nr:SRPBCC family protein [Halogeometricum limi]SFR45153.1 Polyketide cyclase / dehydrase and lipid transport [Halogeometricum limi]
MTSSIRASATTTIDRDVKTVFDHAADPARMDDWVVGVSGTRLVSGAGDAVGDVYEYDYTYGGRTTPMRVELTAFDRPNRVAMRAEEGPFAFEGETTFAADGDRTLVTNTIETGSDGRFTTVMFTVFRPVMRWLMARRLGAELGELKRLVESETERQSASQSETDSEAAPSA